mgnify:CR=1 FL=1
MAQFSQLQNKPVLERDSSNIVGRIKNAYFSQGCKCIVYLVMNSCKNGEETLIPFDDVLSFKDAIVVQNSVNFKSAQDIDFTAFTAGIMDMPIYTQAGVLKGNVSEIEFSQSGKVSKICTETEQFSPSAILSAGNAIILKGAPKTPKAKPAKIPRPSVETLAVIETDDLSVQNDATKVNIARDIFVNTQNDNSDGTTNDMSNTQIAKTATDAKPDYIMQNAILHTAPPAVFVSGNSPLFTKDAFDTIVGEESEYEDTHTPTRVICDYEFLLGRVLGQDLYTYANVPIAKKGDIVTDELVSKARLAGKLVELTLNSIKQE